MKKKKYTKKKKADEKKHFHRLSWKHNLVLILILVLISFLFRFIYYLDINDTPYFLPTGEGLDQNTYIEWAKDIKNGEIIGSGVFNFAPLYPYILSVIFLLTNNNLNYAILVQVLFCSLGSILVFLIGSKLFDRWSGFFAGIIYAAYGALIFFTLQFLGESVVILLLLFSLYFIVEGRESLSRRHFFLSGLFIGIASLGRPNLLIIPFFILLLWGYQEIKKDRNFRKLYIIYLLGFIIAILPVTVRNMVMAKDFVLITSHGGINFYLGNNSNATGTLSMPEEVPPTQKGAVEYSEKIAESEKGKPLKPSEISFYWMKKGFKFIIKNPINYVLLELKKMILFFNSYEIPLDSNYSIYKDRFNSLKFTIGYWLIAPLSLFGMFIVRRKRKKDLEVLLYFLGIFVSVILFYVSSRYRITAVPILMIYAGFSVKYIFDILKKKKINKNIMNVFVLLLLVIFVNINVEGKSRKMYDSISKYNLGNSFINNGDIEGGIELYKDALRLNSEWTPARLSLAAAYNLKAVNAMDNNEYNNAINYLKRAIELDNNVPEYYFNKGNAYIKLEKFEKAVQSFKKAIEISPDYTKGLTNLGVAYSIWGLKEENLNYIQEAMKYLKKSLKIDKNQPKAKEILMFLQNEYLKKLN